MATSFLRAQGIEASVADNVLATVDALMWRAMGGLRVMVPASQLEAARDLLASVRAGEYEIDGDAPEPERRGPGLTLGVLLATLFMQDAGLAARAAARAGLRPIHKIGLALFVFGVLLWVWVWLFYWRMSA